MRHTPLTYPTPRTEAPEATEAQLSEALAVENVPVSLLALRAVLLLATRVSRAFLASHLKAQAMILSADKTMHPTTLPFLRLWPRMLGAVR